jgi:undecaprenyl-diphosphatase
MSWNEASPGEVSHRGTHSAGGWISRRTIAWFVVAVVAVIAVAAAGLLVSTRAATPAIDLWWNGVVGSISSPPIEAISRFLAVAGTGFYGFVLLPLVLVAVMALTRRTFEAIGLIALTLVSLGVVQVIKHLIDRPRPGDIATVSDQGSYPSGHVANAATLGIYLALVYRRVWVWVIASAVIVVMAFSRTFLHAHWFTDILAAAILGAAMAIIFWAIMRLIDGIRRSRGRARSAISAS